MPSHHQPRRCRVHPVSAPPAGPLPRLLPVRRGARRLQLRPPRLQPLTAEARAHDGDIGQGGGEADLLADDGSLAGHARRTGHSWYPCRLHTAPGCWHACGIASSRSKSERYTASSSSRHVSGCVTMGRCMAVVTSRASCSAWDTGWDDPPDPGRRQAQASPAAGIADVAAVPACPGIRHPCL